jgi:uncharacterized protein
VEKRVRTALFIYGGWEGHEPGACVRRMATLLEAEGFRAELSDSLAALDDPEKLKALSLIVPCWTMGELSPERERNLTEAVASGVGLAGWHGGMGDAFRGATAYQFMAGGQFVAHPGDIQDYRVNITDRNHPATRGLDDFDVHSEQYYMHVDPGVRVLATTVISGRGAPWVKGVVMPVVWVKPWGRGRVFYCSIGHTASDLADPPVREIIRRGMIWAAGREG